MINIDVTAESSSHCCGQRLNIHIGSHREINLSQEALVLSQHFKVMSLHCNTGCDSVRLRLSAIRISQILFATLWSLSSNIGDINILWSAKSKPFDLPGDITHHMVHILIALDVLVFHLSLGSRLKHWSKASGLLDQTCS